MMPQATLSSRQIQLLKAIIDAYIADAEPVGSVEVVNRYHLDYSAATVRNEMAQLFSMGFLEMPHTSSGRVPTKMAYRLYLDQLMSEVELPVLQEVALKQRLWPTRFNFERMLREAVVSLAEITKVLAMAISDDGYLVHAGSVNVLNHKEFWEIDSAKAALTILDNYAMVQKIFEAGHFGNEIKCSISDEIGMDNLKKCAIVFSRYESGNKSGYVGVLGPARLNYSSIIPAVRYTKNLIEELGEAW